MRQSLLDELSGALSHGKRITNPLGWLSRVVNLAKNGEFIPSLAPTVAKAREQAQERLELEVQRRVELACKALEQGKEELTEAGNLNSQGRDRVLEMRNKLKRGLV
jgi:hypothetical protein